MRFKMQKQAILDAVCHSGALHAAQALTCLSAHTAPRDCADMIHCNGLKWIRDTL